MQCFAQVSIVAQPLKNPSLRLNLNLVSGFHQVTDSFFATLVLHLGSASKSMDFLRYHLHINHRSGDVAKSTIRLRPDCLPENSVQISHDGMDHGYFLQCSPSDTHFEGAVIAWGPSQVGSVIARSFMEFIENHLQS